MNDHPMSNFLERYPPVPDPERDRNPTDVPAFRRSPRKLPVEATLDLHGLTLEEARTELDAFLEKSLSEGLRKVLVIHGKGLHSDGDARLRSFAQEFLEKHRTVGQLGTPGLRDGGSGATWAILRQRSR